MDGNKIDFECGMANAELKMGKTIFSVAKCAFDGFGSSDRSPAAQRLIDRFSEIVLILLYFLQ